MGLNGKLTPDLARKIVALEGEALQVIEQLTQHYGELHDRLDPKERHARLMAARLHRVWLGIAHGMKTGRITVHSLQAAGQIPEALRRKMAQLGIAT